MSLRIATFNLENLDDRPGTVDFADRETVLRPQLLRLNADCLCLQEINARETSKHGPRLLTALDRLLEGTPYSGFHRAVSLSRPGLRPADRHNLVILSRYPFLETGQVWHDLTAAPQVAGAMLEWDRPLLWAEIALPSEKKLTLINLHLRAPRAVFAEGEKLAPHVWKSASGWAEGFFRAGIKRAGQALEARLFIDRAFDSDPTRLLAVAGDFNATDQETPLRILRADEDDTGNGHLAGRTLVPVERSIPESERYSVIHHGRRQMLDHILVSRPLMGALHHTEIHNETLGDEALSPERIRGGVDSYHAPLVAEFNWP